MPDRIRVGIVGATVTQGGSGWGANAHVPRPEGSAPVPAPSGLHRARGHREGLRRGVRLFFGDQFFWGRVMTDAGAGPEPIPIHRLNSDALAEAFE
jgi:hypothetical protein